MLTVPTCVDLLVCVCVCVCVLALNFVCSYLMLVFICFLLESLEAWLEGLNICPSILKFSHSRLK